MDFRFCPECKQSVLDDDVDECPFCGASMSGKPASKSAPANSAPAKAAPKKKRGLTPRSAASTPPPASTAPSSPKQKAASSTTSSGAKAGFLKDFGGAAASSDVNDSEIFNFDTTRLLKAFALRPKPLKGCTYRVVCPMCETAGFAPHKKAGEEVRCLNKECMVPVFIAPEVAGKKKEVEEVQKSNRGLIIAACLVAVLVIGGGLFFMLQPSPKTPDGPPVVRNGGNQNNSEQNPEENGTNETPTEQLPVDPFAEQEQILETAHLKLVQQVSSHAGNRSKADCRRMAAEIFAMLQQPEEVAAQLEKLDVVGRNSPHFAIPALVELGWSQLHADEKEKLNETLSKIEELFVKLPSRGRFRIDCAIRTIPLLYAVNETEKASQLAQKYNSESTEAFLAAGIHVIELQRTYDLSGLLFEQLIQPWQSPLYSAVTIDLVVHQHPDLALKWALACESQACRSDCLVDWTRSMFQNKKNVEQLTEENIKQAGSGVDTEIHRVRIYSTLASGYLKKDKTKALEYLQKAKDLAEAFAVPEQLKFSTISEIANLKSSQFPSVDLRIIETKAFAELSRTCSQFKQMEESWNYLGKSMKIAHSLAPSPNFTYARVEDMKNPSQVERQLADALGLSSGSATRTKFAQYDTNLKKLHERSLVRFEVQWTILARAINWGLEKQIWQFLSTTGMQGSKEQREPFVSTPLLQLLEIRFRDLKQGKTADQVYGLLAKQPPISDPFTYLFDLVFYHLYNSEPEEAANEINDSKLSMADKEFITLISLNDLVRRNHLREAIDFNKRLLDEVIQEEAWFIISAQAVPNFNVEEYWKLLRREGLSPTKWVSVCRGTIPVLTEFLNTYGKQPKSKE